MLGGKDMKKRSLSNDEKELWKEFSKSAKPLRDENKKNQETNSKINKQINSVNLQDHEKKIFHKEQRNAVSSWSVLNLICFEYGF